MGPKKMGSKNAITTEPRFTTRGNVCPERDGFALWRGFSMAWWTHAPRGRSADDDQACFGCCSGRHLLCNGDAGTIGVTRAARATPDGYTVLWGMWGTNVANGAIYSLDFDLLNDFAPVALVATQPFLIDARKTMPANTLKELIAWLKANPDKATMGTSGVGSPSHVAGVLMEQLVGVKWQMISYRSAGLATQDLLAGITDIQLDTPAVSLTHVRSGDLKAYALTAKQRIAVAPDIPTTDEAGLPGFYFSFWHAMWAPKGTPKPIIARLNAAIVAALEDPDTRKKLLDLAQEIYPHEQQTPEALYVFQKSEVEKWWPIIEAAGIKAE